ncbi:terminase large subunit, partial [Klebsiella pneumoniae]|uniref:terminase large subunit domain-containing protein n=1 Tax=Klebsiella pneumoniae TaxID=573 RepID=UPI00272FD519
ALRSRFDISVWTDSLTRPDGSVFAPMAGETRGGGSPHFAVNDEDHENEKDHMYEAMKMGVGARSHPLKLIITTAGASLGGPCHEQDKEGKEVIEGLT